MSDFETEFAQASSDPQKLEALYRRNRNRFTACFNKLDAAGDQTSPLMDFWRARLSWRSRFDGATIATLIGLAILCWIPTRILMDANPSGSILFTYFPSIFFACWSLAVMVVDKNIKKALPMLGLSGLVALVFLVLPSPQESQSGQLARIHSYLFLWASIPWVLNRFRVFKNNHGRDHIEKTGEMLCWAALFLIGGVLLTLLSLGLFNTLGLNISEFYLKNVVTFGLVLAPFLGLYFTGSAIEFRISSVLAKVFAPLAALTITVFLFLAFLSYGKLFMEKDAFVFYSLIPIAMVAIVFFINSKDDSGPFMKGLNLYLSTLSALFTLAVVPPTLYRIYTWGLTPNKAALLGIELLVLANLVVLVVKQLKALNAPVTGTDTRIPDTIAGFLPLYQAWSALVVLLFPVLFGFR